MHNFPERASAIPRPSHDEFLATLGHGFLEGDSDARKPLGCVEDQPDGLGARIGGTPAARFF